MTHVTDDKRVILRPLGSTNDTDDFARRGSRLERKVTQVAPAMATIPKRKRVAAYARVSGNSEDMLRSLATQVSHYSGLIQKNAEWEYAGVFTDEALISTKDTRPEFQRLLADCRNGLIDFVITKSVTRFACNTVTMLEVVRELKTLGVDVFFEKKSAA